MAASLEGFTLYSKLPTVSVVAPNDAPVFIFTDTESVGIPAAQSRIPFSIESANVVPIFVPNIVSCDTPYIAPLFVPEPR